jgi:hypothetical protein
MNFSGTTKILFKTAAAVSMVLTIAMTDLAADFDGDGRADLSVFRPSSTMWFCESSAGKAGTTGFRWGHASDVLVPADYDGDGRTDFAVWRPENGVWYIHQSGDEGVLLVRWGKTTMHPTGGLPDVPVAADYDGDGLKDLAVFRPDTGEWWVLGSATGYDHDRAAVYRWGKLGDIPVEGDYDGDGRADLAVFRSTENRWYIRESSTGKTTVHAFGLAGLDTLVPADYDGDGKLDVAVYRSGVWYVLDRRTGETEIFHFGFNDDQPVPADYDGDGRADLATYRGGTWYVYESSGPRLKSFNFGLASDAPVGAGVVRQSIVAVP